MSDFNSQNNGANPILNDEGTQTKTSVTYDYNTGELICAISGKKIEARHLKHLLDEGFKLEWNKKLLENNTIFSVDETESIKFGFGCKDKSGAWHDAGAGLVFRFADGFYQIRADKPPQNKSGKPAKYLTPTGAKAQRYDAGDAEWVTEGMKDALMAQLAGGVPMDAVAGVSHIKKVFEQGCRKNVLFDSDGIDNPQVMQALVRAGVYLSGKIALLPKLKGFDKVGVCEYMKALAQDSSTVPLKQYLDGSAADPEDFLYHALISGHSELRSGDMTTMLLKLVGEVFDETKWHGIAGEFKSVSGLPLNTIKKIMGQGAKEANRDKKPPADVMAAEIAEEVSDEVVFDNDKHRWCRYGASKEGVWEPETDAAMQCMVAEKVRDKGWSGYNTNAYIENVVLGLRQLKFTRVWAEKASNEYLPFKNGVLRLSDKKLLPHFPRHYFTWQLEHQYDPEAEDWSETKAFLYWLASEDQSKFNVLMAFCNAVITGRADLQLFLHLIGLPGTGKSTFVRLLNLLVGASNVHATRMQLWCDDKFEQAQAENKRLLTFSDEQGMPKDLGNFLNVTGQDALRAEEKHKRSYKFTYGGMVVVVSNDPIHWGGNKDAIARRQVSIRLSKSVPAALKKDFDPIFKREITAFSNAVLELEPEWVTKVLTGAVIAKNNRLEALEQRLETDPIAAWLNDWVVYDASAKWRVSSPAGKSTRQSGVENWKAFDSYLAYCDESKNKMPVSLKKFAGKVVSTCETVYRLTGVENRRMTSGMVLTCLRARTEDDKNIPTFEMQLQREVLNETLGVDVDNQGNSSHLHASYMQSYIAENQEEQGLQTMNVDNVDNLEKLAQKNSLLSDKDSGARDSNVKIPETFQKLSTCYTKSPKPSPSNNSSYVDNDVDIYIETYMPEKVLCIAPELITANRAGTVIQRTESGVYVDFGWVGKHNLDHGQFRWLFKPGDEVVSFLHGADEPRACTVLKVLGSSYYLGWAEGEFSAPFSYVLPIGAEIKPLPPVVDEEDDWGAPTQSSILVPVLINGAEQGV
jgi:phage/plasmid-associated DNA primase